MSNSTQIVTRSCCDLTPPAALGIRSSPLRLIGRGDDSLLSLYDLCAWLGYKDPSDSARHWRKRFGDKRIRVIATTPRNKVVGRPSETYHYYCTGEDAIEIIHRSKFPFRDRCVSWLRSEIQTLSTGKQVSVDDVSLEAVTDGGESVLEKTVLKAIQPLYNLVNTLDKRLTALDSKPADATESKPVSRVLPAPPLNGRKSAAASASAERTVSRAEDSAAPLFDLFKLLVEKTDSTQQSLAQAFEQMQQQMHCVRRQMSVFYGLLDKRFEHGRDLRRPVNETVVKIAKEAGRPEQEVFNHLYDQLTDEANFDWRAAARNNGRRTLQEIQHQGWLLRLEDLATATLAEVRRQCN